MQRPVASSCLVLPSCLQEVERQNQGLQQELATLREELRAHGPGGEWPSACLVLEQVLCSRSPMESHDNLAGLWRQEFVPDSAA